MENRTPIEITLLALQIMLGRVQTSMMATLITLTEPSMNKGGNPYYGRLKKRKVQNVNINFIYANAVNNQRKREAGEDEEAPETFVPHARKWGQRIQVDGKNTPLIEHKGNVYLEAKPNGKPQSEEFFCDGLPIKKEDIALYLKEKSSNKEHQGVEKEIFIMDYNLANICEIKMNGNHYIIK